MHLRVGLSFTYLSKMHGHSNIQFIKIYFPCLDSKPGPYSPQPAHYTNYSTFRYVHAISAISVISVISVISILIFISITDLSMRFSENLKINFRLNP